MALFRSIHRQIDQWQSRELIDSATAQRLHEDLIHNKVRFGLGSVLAVLGAVLLGAAIIMFIAANWQEIPRIARVLMIVAIIWFGYIGGAWRQLRNDVVFAPALYLIAALTYGAGIALVGQMYHLSGDVDTALLFWAGGVLLAAFLLRASILTITAGIISLFYLTSVMLELNSQLEYQQIYIWVVPTFALLGSVAVWYTNSRYALHWWLLLILGYGLILYIDFQQAGILLIMIVAGIALVALQGGSKYYRHCMGAAGAQLAAYGMVATLMALGVLQIEDWEYLYGDIGFYSVLGLGLCIGALLISGGYSTPLRWVSYAGFSIYVLHLAVVTVGTMIGTSGLFLTAGILVLLLASFVTRMEKRLRNVAKKVDENEGDHARI